MQLNELRTLTKKLRSFDADTYISQKVERLNSFFRDQNLDSCVLGMSGGVDSATVLGLLFYASKLKNSPIRKILPIMAPIHGDGVTGQNIGLVLANKQCKSFGIAATTHDLTDAHAAYFNTLESDIPSSWANGQLACILRTPCFYYHAAILQTKGYNSIVVGTTDRDEGSYIGFYGKASDAMVDLQPIADIHKSEVQEIGRTLGVIPEITVRTPTGDVWNGITSEEMIGAPLWFLEMYLILKEHRIEKLAKDLTLDDKEIYEKYSSNIETLHKKNAHKYKVGLPSHFIDCMPRSVPGGW